MQTLRFSHDYPQPPAEVFAWMSEHENMNVMFAPIRVERVADGSDGTRNGVGSRRRLSFWGALGFEETITASVLDERIAYEITKGSPLKDHHGEVRFSPTPSGGTHMDYTIAFAGKLPGIDRVVALGLERSVKQGLPRVAT